MTFLQKEMLVQKWAEEKGIFEKATHMDQFEKTTEEVAELGSAIEDANDFKIMDELGDVVVTLIIQAKMWDLTLEECLDHAYKKISKRTGKMVNGKFVKDAY